MGASVAPGHRQMFDFAHLVKGFTSRPILLIAAAFALGIQAASWWDAAAVAALLGLAGAFAIPGVRNRPWAIAAILCGFAASGALRLLVGEGPAANDVARVLPDGPVHVRGVVVGDVDLRATAYTCPLAIRCAVLPNGSVILCSGRVAARLARDPTQEPPSYGDTLEVRGTLTKPPGKRNPGGFDYRAYLAHRGVYATLNVRRPAGWVKLPAGVEWFDWLPNLASRCRMSLLHALGRVLPKAEAGLAAGILLGTRTELPPQMDDDFVATGTVHVLATAGLHVGIVAFLILTALRMARLPTRLAAVMAIVALITYAIMAGARPSVLRATVMACVFLFGMVLDREGDVPAALATSALFLLLLEPNYLFDVGFQLSFATVACIVALMPIFEVGIQRVTDAFTQTQGWSGRVVRLVAKTAADVVAVTTGAQLGSAPLTAQYFNMVSLAGIPANAVIVPLLVVVFAAGFGVWLLTAVWMPAARFVAHVLLSPVLTYLVGAAHVFAHMPAAAVPLPSPGWGLIWLYYALVFLAAALLRVPRARAGSRP